MGEVIQLSSRQDHNLSWMCIGVGLPTCMFRRSEWSATRDCMILHDVYCTVGDISGEMAVSITHGYSRFSLYANTLIEVG